MLNFFKKFFKKSLLRKPELRNPELRKPELRELELEQYVGETIEVYYLDYKKKPVKEIGLLKFPPTSTFFYLGRGEGYHLIEIEKVKSIRNTKGRKIYENKALPFAFNSYFTIGQ